MNLREMMSLYYEDGLSRELSSARICQDIILKAISEGPLSRNVTIKGGVVMRSLTQNNRRATRDIDLDFIHYSLSDESVRQFVKKLNCLPDISIEIEGDLEELKHEDYHGKRVKLLITDESGTTIRSKMDIGVHKHLEIEQDEYCFDVCMDDEGASLLKNTVEQSFVEKLRSLLIFGVNSRRYKDIFDMYYLKDLTDIEKLKVVVKILVLDDPGMRENSINEIIFRLSDTFKDEQYLSRISTSRQRWIDEDIHDITEGIINTVQMLKMPSG